MASSAQGFQEPPTLGYHKIRGLAAPLRMMFAYKQQPYKNVAYANDLMDTWFNSATGEKPGLFERNACINLPYIIAKDPKTGEESVITQSNTCLLYLGQKLGIDTMCDAGIFFHNHTILDQVYDWRDDLMKIVYPFAGKVKTKEDFPEFAKTHMADVKKTHLKKLENFCKGPTYMCGTDGPQSGDFHLWEMIDQHIAICKKLGLDDFLGDDFPKLKNLYVSFKAISSLEAYFNSEAYLSYAHNNGMFTHFTGQDDTTFNYGTTTKTLVC